MRLRNASHPFLRLALFLTGASMAGAFVSPAAAIAQATGPCDAFESLLTWQGRTYEKTMAGVQASQRDRSAAAIASAQSLFERYLAGRRSAFSASACGVGAEGRAEFDFARGPTFFAAARTTLEVTNEPRVLRLLARIDGRFGVSGVPPVRLVLEGRLPSDPALAAGVARGSKALFANLEEIPPADWNIVFVHELTHLVDQTLDEAVARWQDETLRTGAMMDAKGSLAGPNAFDRIDRWLQAGLDRGFLAEYRAWVVTSEIYAGLRALGLQQPLPWMDGLASPGVSVDASKKRVFSFLEPRFTNPTDGGLLSRAPFAERLEFLRAGFSADAVRAAPSLGSLDAIVTFD